MQAKAPALHAVVGQRLMAELPEANGIGASLNDDIQTEKAEAPIADSGQGEEVTVHGGLSVGEPGL